MSIKNDNIILVDMNDNDIWKQCSKCGVLSYKSTICKPCNSKIQLSYINAFKKTEITTLIDIVIQIIFNMRTTKTNSL